MKVIVQLGSTRDGLEPYKDRGEAHGMECVLIETPEYLKLREQLGRQKFARTISVNHPADADEVIQVLKENNVSPFGIIAGFERYNYSAYEVAKKLNILPYDKEYPFKPLTKNEERDLLKKTNSRFVLQPQYFLLKELSITPKEISHMSYPLVVKPVDGGGGLGTFVVNDFTALTKAMEELKGIKNYDGGDFAGIMIEEFIAGHEYSIQGFVREGKVTILSLGKKFIFTEETTKDSSGIHIFRESGLMAIGGDYIDNNTRKFTETCIKTFNYRNGAFHIDMKRTAKGDYFLEMGFRVSGFGIVNLIEKISGYNWAEETFSSLLQISPNIPHKEVKNQCIGQVRARLTSEIENAEKLAKTHKNITVELMNAQPQKVFSERLKSDITRHAGTIGKITVEGKTVDEVESLLLKCLSERAAHRVE